MPSITRRNALGTVAAAFGSVAGCVGLGSDGGFPMKRSWHSGIREPSSVGVTSAGQLVAGSRSPFRDRPLVAGLDMETGETTWTVTVPKGVKSPVTVTGQRAYAASKAGVVVSVDTTNGEVVWRHELTAVRGADPGVVEFAPVLSGEQVVVPISGRENDVIDRVLGLAVGNGETQFAYPLPSSLAGAPGATARGVVAPTLDGHLRLIDRTGSVQWDRAVGGAMSGVATRNGTAYVGAATEELLAVDVASGSVAWRGALANTVFPRPLVTDDRVYVGGADYTLRAFDAETGNQQWRDDLSNAVTHGPVRVDDRLVTLVGGKHRVRGPSGTVPFSPTALYVHDRDGTRVREVRFDDVSIDNGSIEWLQAAGDTVYLGQTFGLTRVAPEAITDA